LLWREKITTIFVITRLKSGLELGISALLIQGRDKYQRPEDNTYVALGFDIPYKQ
jgi:hypothetical protein